MYLIFFFEIGRKLQLSSSRVQTFPPLAPSPTREHAIALAGPKSAQSTCKLRRPICSTVAGLAAWWGRRAREIVESGCVSWCHRDQSMAVFPLESFPFPFSAKFEHTNTITNSYTAILVPLSRILSGGNRNINISGRRGEGRSSAANATLRRAHRGNSGAPNSHTRKKIRTDR
jgi:hypothetical protein